ncbi:zinc finger MYND domain-containing protein 12 [Lingula anatina]|uniref:Zinc finger MYND domain-containing protein 12 n=1 Tax=Lingula anatina TaxID=7574 RepID=A0A1S3J1M0_LINAN|nr:zinc finger MYND domain-containing protein 12 [Lingula anatina]|eukprot:XP_013404320.1 zinc finger MYND domain-containing protein 12 [Lingula anatina]
MTLNPLANPKGVKLVCELCQKPAFIQCTKCRVTYYCGVEHQKADWLGIHEKICQLLIPLRTPIPFLASDEERQHRKDQLLQRQRHMIDLTRTTGQKLLFEGRHEQAVPAAMQSLRFAIEVHGLASIELVPSYLILGEASIGLGRLSQAEEYLMQAQWTVVKTPECSDAIKSKLYRNLGLLYAAKGEYEESLRQLADDIFHASMEFSPDDIRTSGGYFHMANVFFRQNRMEVADSLYARVTDSWYDYLQKIVSVRTATPIDTTGIGAIAMEINQEEEEGLDEAQEAEAKQVLNAIYDIRDQQSNKKPEIVAKICHALAMLYFILHEVEKAKEYGRKAVVTSEGNPDDELSRSIVEFMKICDSVNEVTM